MKIGKSSKTCLGKEMFESVTMAKAITITPFKVLDSPKSQRYVK